MKFKRLFTVLTLANLLLVSMVMSLAGIAYAQDPTLSKTVSPSTATTGDTITYTISFSNTDNATAAQVVITDAIPLSVSVQSVISSGVAITQTVNGQTYTWRTADLGQGDGGVITITGILSNPSGGTAHLPLPPLTHCWLLLNLRQP